MDLWPARAYLESANNPAAPSSHQQNPAPIWGTTDKDHLEFHLENLDADGTSYFDETLLDASLQNSIDYKR